MLTFKEFQEEDGIDYFIIEIPEKLINEALLLSEGEWVDSGKKHWMVRVDAARPEIKQRRHVHIAKEKHVNSKNMQASWNDDQSKHDKKTFNSKIGSLDIVQSLAKQALNLSVDVKLEEATRASNLLFLINESANTLGIKPTLFIVKA